MSFLAYSSVMPSCWVAVDMFPVLDAGATRVKQVRASIEA
jgi:hypothetical protein